jgi:hypothetical protein
MRDLDYGIVGHLPVNRDHLRLDQGTVEQLPVNEDNLRMHHVFGLL